MPGSALPTRTRVVRPDGTALSVLHHPLPDPTRASGPLVLFAHGLGSDAVTNWEQAGWVRALHRIGRPAVSFDLRGHGLSDHPIDEQRYRLALLVGDLRAVLETVDDGGPVDAIGYSLGARLLLELVADDVPIRRLVLGGTAGQPQLQGIDVDLIERTVGDVTVATAPLVGETARIARTISALPTNDPVALSALVRGLHGDPEMARRTPDPALPALIGVGTEDPLHDLSAAWTAGLPNADFLSIPGRNHVSAVPSGLFRAAAMEFLGRP